MQIRYSNIGTEPIDLDTAKSWLRVDFDTDDTLITSLIKQVRELAEKATGLSLVQKTIEYFEEDEDILAYWIKLPYPEHNEITEVVLDGSTITDYLETGLTQKLIKVSGATTTDVASKGLKVTYTTTGNIPNGMELAMLKEIAEAYEKRGNSSEYTVNVLTSSFISYCQQFRVY